MRKSIVLIIILMFAFSGCTMQKPNKQLYGTYSSDEGYRIIFIGSRIVVVHNDIVENDYKYTVENGKYIIDTEGEAHMFIDNISDDLKSFTTTISAYSSRMRKFVFLNDSIKP